MKVKQSHKVAIEVKYLPATNYKPSRLKASANGNSLTMSQPSTMQYESFPAYIAKEFCKKMGWNGNLIQGTSKNGYVFVFTS
jgi:hypothetical protein